MQRNAQRRGRPRQAVNLRARIAVRVGTFNVPLHVAGRILAISRGGALIAVPAWAAGYFRVGRLVDVRIDHAPMAETPLRSKVVWMRGCELGVRFLSRSAPAEAAAGYGVLARTQP